MLLPGITLPVVAGKPRSVAVVESTMLTENQQLIVTAIRPEAQKRWEGSATAEIEDLKEIYSIATLAVVHQLRRLPMGLVQLIVEGLERVEIAELVQTNPTYEVKFRRLPALDRQTALERGTEEQTIEA